jgi:hypothetical protein
VCNYNDGWSAALFSFIEGAGPKKRGFSIVYTGEHGRGYDEKKRRMMMMTGLSKENDNKIT